MKRDIFISVLGHLTLIALVIIINPATSILGSGPEVLSINLGSMDLPAPGNGEEDNAPPPVVEEEESTPLSPPDMPAILADEIMEESFNVQSNEPLAKIEKPKPKKEPQKEVKQQKQEPKETEQPQESTNGDGKKRLDVQGNVGTGDGASGSAIGSGQSNMPYNMRMLESKIERVWNNPVRSSEPISCEVYFVISRDGALVGTPVIEKSSGISVYDNEAIYSILRAGKFPPFPVNFEYDELGITLQIEYRP